MITRKCEFPVNYQTQNLVKKKIDVTLRRVNNNKMNLVVVKNVMKSYQLGQSIAPALQGLSLTLQTGEFAAVVGASGSGKTTLFNLLGCLDDFDSGEIEIDGQIVQNLSENERSELRSKKIGFIFQNFNLIPVLSARENVALPLILHDLPEAEKTKRVEQALTDVGLKDFFESKPDQLSGGQRQRVAIARALVTRPKLILADEPTANLDSVTTHKIIDLMLDLNRRHEVTFLLSTHDEKLMSRVGRIIRLQDGVVVDTHKAPGTN